MYGQAEKSIGRQRKPAWDDERDRWRDASDRANRRSVPDDQSGHAGLRQPELAESRRPRPDAARRLRPAREDHPLRSRADPRAHRPRARLRRPRLLPGRPIAGEDHPGRLPAGPKQKTPVFARFSTVAGGAGSVDMPRDVRGFAVKFYTHEGNFDLVGNNIPVFFIQDAIKFPDLVHAVKMEPDRGFPQAASAHDTFWDFVSLMPESMHMLIWAMSDRAHPALAAHDRGLRHPHLPARSTRKGESTFVKFHWRPLLGTQSVVWDEARQDQRRRSTTSIAATCARRSRAAISRSGSSACSSFDEKTADELRLRLLDRDQAHPRGDRPAEVIGRMVLDRNPDNFFAETEQVAFHPGQLVPGIDVQRRSAAAGPAVLLHRHAALRLGGPNFHEIPINRPKCPLHNFQRDGLMQHAGRSQGPRRTTSRTASTPASAAREPERGFATASPTPDDRRRSCACASETLRRSLQPGAPVLPLDDGAGAAPHRRPRSPSSSAKVETVADPHAHARSSDLDRHGARHARRRALGHGRQGRRDHAGAHADRSAIRRRRSASSAVRPRP